MNKKYLLAMAAVILIAWAVQVNFTLETPREYQSLLTQAQDKEHKKIYDEAAELYRQSLELQPNRQTAGKLLELYAILRDDSGYLYACNYLIRTFPEDEEGHVKKIEYYLAASRLDNAVDAIIQAKAALPGSERVNELYLAHRYTYKEYTHGFQEAGGFSGGFAPVCRDGLWGYVAESGSALLEPAYSQAGPFDAGGTLAPVCQAGEWFYIDKKGMRRLVPDEPYGYLGAFGAKTAPAQKDGQWGYVSKNWSFRPMEGLERLTVINGGAMVGDAERWGILNVRGKLVTGLDYEDIRLDAGGQAFAQGYAAVKTAAGWTFVDPEGKALTNEVFEDAGAPGEGGLCPVAREGLWGYADSQGVLVIPCAFEAAGSFGAGLAPVRTQGKWGYIDRDGQLVIQPKWEEAGVLSKKGAAVVRDEEGCNIIVLNRL